MRLLRISLADSIAGIVIAALGLAILRIDLTNEPFWRHGHTLVVGVLPMACLLVWGLWLGIGRLISRNECPSFLVGFEVLGWGTLFLFVVYDAAAYQMAEEPLFVASPLLHWFFATDTIIYKHIEVLIFHFSLFFLPSFVISLIGGWLSQTLGIRLVRRQPIAGAADAKGHDDKPLIGSMGETMQSHRPPG
jgi:hypothetical protein